MKKLLLSILAILLCVSAITVLASCTKEEIKAPTFEIVNPVAYKSSVEFEIAESDPDNIGEIISIELYKGDSKIRTAENKDVRRFEGLDSNTTYTIKVKYEYDLQNGEGEKTDSVSLDIKTTDGFSSKTNIKTDWSGKTLNIACSTWSAEPRAPWSVLELCVDYGKESGFGTKIDAAVLERQEFIKETYGVDLNFIAVTRYAMHDALEEAIISGNVYYDLALPRAMRVQSIVAGGYIYDLANRDYIDFSNSYYNKSSVEAYTAKGHTFFMDGDFSTISKETASVLYFNKELLGGEQAAKDLYQKVREGKWTYDDLVALASAAYKDNGDGIHGNGDTYGLGLISMTDLYRFFNTSQAGVNKKTGEWRIALKDGRENEIVSALIELNKSNWCVQFAAWNRFEEGYVLFCVEIVQYSSNVPEIGNVGVLPFPMMNEEQGRYCVPCGSQMSTLMCIPKNTQDRAMSEYFLDVLVWTGSEYTYKAYLEQKAEHFKADEDMEMLTEYIFPNIVYDAGAAVGWGSLMRGVLSDSYKGNVNNFDKAYAEQEPEALETIAKWNTAWGAYKE